MMVNIDFSKIKNIHKNLKGFIITLIINWLINPFFMALLGILFFELIFVDLVNPEDDKLC